MISGGNATVYVDDLDRATEFYKDVLGLELEMHVPGHWVQLRAGRSLTIGLHPRGPQSPVAGSRGAISIGLTPDRPIKDEIQRLEARGVSFDAPPRSDGPITLASFSDPDGNPLYLASYT